MEKRNVLLLMADQLRADFIDFRPGDHCLTPHLRDLYAQSVQVPRAYTTSPICAPARISLATGMYPQNLGCADNACYLPLSRPTFYQILRDHGYRTGIVGKTDLAKANGYLGVRGDRPEVFSMGFTHPFEVEGKNQSTQKDAARGPYGAYLASKGLLKAYHAKYRSLKNGRHENWIGANVFACPLPEADFIDTFIGDAACRWLEENTAEFPWLLQVCFAGPHTPFDPPESALDEVRQLDLQLPVWEEEDLSDKPAWVRAYQQKFGASGEDIREARLHYAAVIRLIDRQIGRIVGALESTGRAEDTCVIFTSDHGEMAGTKGLFTKHVAYEPSARIPMSIRLPGAAPRVCGGIAELSDLFPTILEYCGAPCPTVDAVSLLPAVCSEQETGKEYAVCTELNYRALVGRSWKYIENINDTPELYDLSCDPGETRNLASAYPDELRKMQKTLKAILGGNGLNR